MPIETSSEAFFEAKYSVNSDPWNFSGSPYEQSRYAATMAALGARRFQRVFEPGCSIGVLTARLAEICDGVEALEISRSAVEQAQRRCQAFPHIRIRHGVLPSDIPNGGFDLIVFSEIGYYFAAPVLRDLARKLSDTLIKDGLFLSVHWLGHSSDHQLPGDAVHGILSETPGFRLALRERHAGFRLDLWSKA